MVFQSQQLDNMRYYPMLFVGLRGDAAVAALTQMWSRYKTISQEKKDILLSDEMPQSLISLQKNFRLSDDAISVITIAVRKIFFGELSFEQAETKIGSMLTTIKGGDPNQTKAIVQFIKDEIMTIKPKPKAEEHVETSETVETKIEHLPLLQAITKYGQLGQQAITRERIKIKTQAEPARPSLINWIKYYRSELGVGFHDGVQRGNFLFRSENCKKLSPEERERINLILKSIEENYPLPIDAIKSEIVFPEFASLHPHAAVTPAQISQSANVVSPQPILKPENNGNIPTPSHPIAAAIPVSPKKTIEKTPEEHASQNPYLGGTLGIFQNKPKGIAPQPVPDSGISFSSNHVFPAEKEQIKETAVPVSPKPAAVQDMPQAVKPVSAEPVVAVSKPVAQHTNPFHIRPVSRSAESTASFKP